MNSSSLIELLLDCEKTPLLKHPGDTATVSQLPPFLENRVPQICDGSVSIVGKSFDKNGNTTRAIALVGNFIVRHTFELSSAAFDRTIDVVVGHVAGFGILDRGPKPGISRRITAADSGCDRDLFEQLGPQLPRRASVTAFFRLIWAHLL